jgi:hypothetical protein
MGKDDAMGATGLFLLGAVAMLALVLLAARVDGFWDEIRVV